MSPLLALSMACFLACMVFALVVMGWREAFLGAWKAAPPPGELGAPQCVSMVVPARDAAETITALLQDLHAQRWPKEMLEVIVVDDHSRDGTARAVRSMMPLWPGLKLLPAAGEGKKAAITQAVQAAGGEWLILTDADARCGPERVPRIMQAMAAWGADLLLLPVETRSGGGLLGRVQADEQAALLGVAAGSALQGRPMLANGANLAFRKSAFLAVGGYAGDRWASGDDVFLLRRMCKAGLKVAYLPAPEAVVQVDAETGWAAFFRQRLRWAGKMRGVGGGGNWAAAAALLLPWGLLALWCSITVDRLLAQRPLATFLLLCASWLLWLLPVVALVLAVRRFLREADPVGAARPCSPCTALSFIAFSFYAPVIAVLALFIRPVWKGRRV